MLTLPLADCSQDIELGGGTSIDYPEFLTLMGRAAKELKEYEEGGAKGKYHNAFKIINRSGDGNATIDELAHFFETIEKPQDAATVSTRVIAHTYLRARAHTLPSCPVLLSSCYARRTHCQTVRLQRTTRPVSTRAHTHCHTVAAHYSAFSQ